MRRGDPDHVSNDAEALLNSAAVKELRERMTEQCARRLRGTNTNDAEECRGAVATFQANAAMWDTLERMVSERDVRERTVSEVV